jgi:hypothetical protein
MLGRRTRFGFISVLVWVALQSPATSQDAKPPSGNDKAPPETVIVTGRHPDQKTLDEVVHAFVDAHGKYSPKIEQLTRWVTPVCPEVRNIPAGYAAFIITRIKAIAASVGAPTRQPCQLNIEIIFTPDPQAILDKVAATDPRLLGYHFIHDAKRAATVT